MFGLSQLKFGLPKGNDMTKGLVFDIKKFAIHDGPGIRTTVFLKGCPLNCLWCHNPESISGNPELSFLPDKCIGCGYCFEACPNKAHQMDGDKHVIKRDICQQCGICNLKCYAHALELIGKEMTVEEALTEVMKDKPFYETSGGGMTISGGEPMAQFEFTKELLTAAKKEDLHTCLDTSGFAKFAKYEELLKLVDIFLYDIKETDPGKHQDATGVPIDLIQENLQKLDQAGAKTVLRCPVIPGMNDREDHFAKIAELADSLSNVLEINIQPYHPLGKSKNERIGKEFEMGELSFPDDATTQKWLETIQAKTKIPVKKG